MNIGATRQGTSWLSLNPTHLKNSSGHSLPLAPRRICLLEKGTEECHQEVTDSIILMPVGSAMSIQPQVGRVGVQVMRKLKPF